MTDGCSLANTLAQVRFATCQTAASSNEKPLDRTRDKVLLCALLRHTAAALSVVSASQLSNEKP